MSTLHAGIRFKSVLLGGGWNVTPVVEPQGVGLLVSSLAEGMPNSSKTGETGLPTAVNGCANPCANTVRITHRSPQNGAKPLLERNSRKEKATPDIPRVAFYSGGGVWESNPPSAD